MTLTVLVLITIQIFEEQSSPTYSIELVMTITAYLNFLAYADSNRLKPEGERSKDSKMNTYIYFMVAGIILQGL